MLDNCQGQVVKSFLTQQTPYNDQRAVMEGRLVATTKDIAGIRKSGK